MSSVGDAGTDANSGSVGCRPTAVQFIGVSKTYAGPPPVEALHPCSFQIGPGDYVAITGPSGSGKSTLLNLLGLLDRPTAGTYVLGGTPTHGLKDAALASLRSRHLGFVFQAFHLVNYRSAVENVMLSLTYQGVSRGERKTRATESLESVNLGHRLHARPSELSGGERQRVAIARAIIHRPTLLLCDEPTGNLDTETARSVLNVLDELNAAHTTVVLVTHDREVAARAARHITIRDGLVDAGASGGTR